MQPLYEPFFRRFGVRLAEQLKRPPLPKLDLLELPRESILHFVTASPVDIGPASDEFLFRKITRPIMMQHVMQLASEEGSPRLVSLDMKTMTTSYFHKNRRFRPFKDVLGVSRDKETLVVYSYGVLPHRYRYNRGVFASYYEWLNIQNTVWTKAAEVAKVTDRQQFIVCHLPQTLPSVTQLEMAEGGMTMTALKVFNNPDKLFLLEMWKWLGEERATSILAKLDRNALKRINLVFQETGRWFVVNLGKLDTWRKPTKSELEADAALAKLDPNHVPLRAAGVEPRVIRKFYLRLMMSLFEVRTVALGDEPLTRSLKKAAELVGTQGDVNGDGDSVPEDQGTENKVVTAKLGADVLSGLNPGRVTDAYLNRPDATIEAVTAKVQAEERDVDDDLGEQGDNGEVAPEGVEVHTHDINETRTPEHGVLRVCDSYVEQGMMSVRERARFAKLAGSYRSIPAPSGKGTLEQYMRVDPSLLKIEESTAIPDIKTVTDKSMLKSSLYDFDEKYIRNVLGRDVAGMVMSVQNAGVAVTGYEVEKIDEVLGAYEMHTVRVTPTEGAPSTLRFKLPVVSAEGVYKANGVDYRLRKQRSDMPIRKIAPARVALTSYYGKVMVDRSSKKVNDYGNWLRNQVMMMGLDDENLIVTELHPAVVFDNQFKAPRAYTVMAQGFRGFRAMPQAYSPAVGQVPIDFVFDHTKRQALVHPAKTALLAYEPNGEVLCGKTRENQLVRMTAVGDIEVLTDKGWVYMGSLEAILGIQDSKAPVDYAEISVMGRTVPVGMVLAYEMGLDKLMLVLGVVPRRVPVGTRAQIEPTEFALVFQDETLVFDRANKKASMLLAGFREFRHELRRYSVYEFNRRGVYLNMLEAAGGSARTLREIDLMYQLFVDPITRELLVEMKEPTDFRGLLLRASEMLTTDTHPDELDSAFMRIKGYERIAGAVYSEMVRTLRTHNGRMGRARFQLDMPPYAVWKTIAMDSSVTITSDINPINNLRELEAVTYSGVGGRNFRSMTKNTRAYHPNDMGVISEATVDSSDVAINTYLSADPQFTSLRGTSRRYEIGKTGATALLSSAALVSQAADRDDFKRVNFIGIQHRHGIACSGYQQLPVRTGYEQIIAHRVSDLFALTAKKPGEVISVTETGMVVKYADGEERGIELGRRFGNASGLTIPHRVVTELKAGQKFKAGDLICYNPDFFQKDLLNPKQVVWMGGVLVPTVLMESTDTLEDSSAISQHVANQLSARMTKVKTVVVRFDQTVSRIVKPGTAVKSDDILCTIEESVTAQNAMFDDESLDTLRMLSSHTPQAKIQGTVERVEVFYHGDVEDMSESLRTLAAAGDREMSRRSRSAGKPAYTGSVDEGFRVDGDPLPLDTVALRFYITADVSAGVGDKGVFCNQLKTVFGRIMAKPMRTESGVEVHAVFGYKSVMDRIVGSPEVMGTTASLLRVIGHKAAEIYEKG